MAHSISYLNCQLSLKCTIFFGIEILLRAYLVYKKSSNLVYKYYLSLFLSFSPFHQLILPISINFLIHCSTNNPPWKGHALHLVSVLLVAEPLWCCDSQSLCYKFNKNDLRSLWTLGKHDTLSDRVQFRYIHLYFHGCPRCSLWRSSLHPWMQVEDGIHSLGGSKWSY